MSVFNLQLILRGKTGVLKSKYKGKTPVLLRRDGSPEDVYTQTGEFIHDRRTMVVGYSHVYSQYNSNLVVNITSFPQSCLLSYLKFTVWKDND